MRIDSLWAESGTGCFTCRAHPQRIHPLRLDVPVDDLSTPLVPTMVGTFDRQGGRNSENTWGRTHDAPGVRGIMPLIDPDTIRFVLDTLTLRGPT